MKAFETSSKVREKTTNAFESEDLERTFGIIELFLATFPDDPNVEKSAIELVATLLRAVENTIGFFLTSSGEFNMTAPY